MSEDQLKKLKAEREALVREEKLLEEAIKPEDAAKEMVAYTTKHSQDPFNSQDNEWTKIGDGPGCCTIM